MKFRKATSKDAKGIAKVLVQSYNIKDVKEGISAFKEEVQKKYNFIIAVDNGKVVGLTTWQLHGLPKHQLCELDRIAVLPECRGKGVAQKLFADLSTRLHLRIIITKKKMNGFILCFFDYFFALGASLSPIFLTKVKKPV